MTSYNVICSIYQGVRYEDIYQDPEIHKVRAVLVHYYNIAFEKYGLFTKIKNPMIFIENIYILKNIQNIFIACLTQGYNARKVNCSCVYSAYILKPVLSEFVNKNTCISARLVSEEVKSIQFW